MLELCLRLSQAPPLPDKPKTARDRDEAWAADLLLHTAKLHTKVRRTPSSLKIKVSSGPLPTASR
jgi:hypothetical protein